jgi:hypothetical protein
MPKRRGRPRKASADRKSARLSIRVSALLRDQLEVARRGPGGEQTLADEVQQRLWGSFKEEEKIASLFGGEGTARVLRMLIKCIKQVEDHTGDRWLGNGFVHHQVRTAIDIVLDHFKPKGRAMPERLRRLPALKKNAESIGKYAALHALVLLQLAKTEEMPIDLPPVTAYDAKRVLGHKLRGNPAAAFEKLRREQQRQQLPPSGRAAKVALRENWAAGREATVKAAVEQLTPVLVKGAINKIDWRLVMARITDKNFTNKKVVIVNRLRTQLESKLKDAGISDRVFDGLAKLLDKADDVRVKQLALAAVKKGKSQ